MKKILVSRHGLTGCPGCGAHIRLAESAEQTECPFCGASLLRARSLRGLVASGRSGFLAASLVGLTVLGGCGSDEEDTGKNDALVMDTAPDSTMGDVYGLPADTAAEDVPEGDTTITMDTAPDSTMGDVYGLPADIEDAPDMPPVDLYGLPPDATP